MKWKKRLREFWRLNFQGGKWYVIYPDGAKSWPNTYLWCKTFQKLYGGRIYKDLGGK